MTRLSRLMRGATATAAAAAIAATAVTASAAPARASSSSDLLKLLAGAAAVGLIVRELDRGARAKPRDHGRIDPAPKKRGKGHGAGGRHRSTTAIPQHCQLRTRGNHRGDSYYSARCLRGAGLSPRQLPNRCETRLRTRNGHVQAYSGRCLRDAGFRVARR